MTQPRKKRIGVFMKREEIKTLLGKLGVEIDTDKEKEFISAILDANGNDITHAKNGVKTYETEYNDLTEKLKSYEKGGKNYVDLDEYNALKTYKETAEAEKIKTAKDKAIKTLVDGENFDDKAKKLLYKAVADYNPEYDEQYNIKNADTIKQSLKNDYADFILSSQTGGATATKTQTQKTETDPFLQGFNSK